jgi:nucleoside-diphosphate-sugar epimerase
VTRALVTGATGGIGISLVEALLGRGQEVVASGRNHEAGARLAAMGAAFRPADLVHDPLEPLLAGADTVYHLAARSAPWGPRAGFEADNVQATRRLLEAARGAGVRRFVFASTPSIYVERRDRIGLTEDSPVAAQFTCAYARTKYAAERLVLAADSPDMRTIAVRPRAAAGPDDTALFPRLARVARRGRIPLPRGGAALIDITDVRDVADAFVAAGRDDAPGGIGVNVSGGAPLPFGTLVAEICHAAGLPFRPRPVSEPLLDAIARLGEAASRLTGREPAITRHAAMAIAWSQTFDLAGARRLLGWSPRYRLGDTLDFALGKDGR